jgi:hypothetical protein
MPMLRLHRKAAMVALGAAIVGITIATPAQAAELGTATVKNNGSWGAGYDACKANYRNTQSVKLTFAEWEPQPNGQSVGTWIWKCYNTNNTT